MQDRTRYAFLDLTICLLFLIVPLLIRLPYRVNIFLSWEGAYRLYLGQMPYRDFGLPLGFGYWIIPALFFKIFGPSFLSLVKAQVLINVISIVSLRGILYNLKLKPVLVSLSILIFCLTYLIYNFWPWYNHSVIVFEMAALYFVTRALSGNHERFRSLNLVLSAFVAFLSFFTKQDAGALCFMICMALLIYHSVSAREYFSLGLFTGSYFAVAALVILPFVQYDFLYWFNYGQPPHSSRLSAGNALGIFFGSPNWEKIYLFLFLIILMMGRKEKITSLLNNRYQSMLSIITIALVAQAILTQVTSPLPGNITYFHAFGVALLICVTPLNVWIGNLKNATAMALIIGLSFSAGYWKYVNGFLGLSNTRSETETMSVSSSWVPSPFRGFDDVLMPGETVLGISRLLDSEFIKKEDLKVLNMSELTPLALEMNYTPPVNQPLWYHLNIGIFQKEVDELCQRVKNKEYDVVLFEDIPDLTHFYPYQVRDTLRQYYRLQDKFLAPRKLENSTIEVYVK